MLPTSPPKSPPSPHATHEVTNQSPPFEDVNLFTSDAALGAAVAREMGPEADAVGAALTRIGALAGSAHGLDIGRLANENPPRLRRFDDKGRAIDIVEFHPAYHQAMTLSMEAGLHCSTWDAAPDAATSDGSIAGSPIAGGQVARAAALYMLTQMESGHICPLTMTHAAMPALARQPDILAAWRPLMLSRQYDQAFKPWTQKTAVTLGMGMTEKQGGTDVRTNTTRATPESTAGPGRAYRLTGHKWFMSAPMSDGFLMLAQAAKGLTCFLVPRFTPDGRVNGIRLQRLKDKLGNRSNASSEVELENAFAWAIGEEGRGVASIMEMVTQTRLDCAVASAGQMRLALAHALHHTRHRVVMQRKLVDQPLMAQVLADIALDVEAATALAFRLARAFDRAPYDPHEAAWMRLMTPVTKYWVCKIAPALGYEAMECLGGNGYVEEGLAARLYREMPLNAIWEGSGNVMALDVLRVLQRDADAADSILDELDHRAQSHKGLRAGIDRVRAILADPRQLDTNARSLTEALALVAAGVLLHAHAPAAIAEPFIASRSAGGFRQTYGAGMRGADAKAILARALPGG